MDAGSSSLRVDTENRCLDPIQQSSETKKITLKILIAALAIIALACIGTGVAAGLNGLPFVALYGSVGGFILSLIGSLIFIRLYCISKTPTHSLIHESATYIDKT